MDSNQTTPTAEDVTGTDPDVTTADAEPITRVIGARRQVHGCRNHPEAAATARCSRCATPLCEHCQSERKWHLGSARICTCGGVCEDFEPQEPPPLLDDFARELLRAAAWPFERGGLRMLLVSSGLFALMLGFTAAVPAIGMVFGVLIAGYVCAFAANIVVSTADGEDEIPAWPDVENIADAMVLPLARTFLLGVACFAPAFLLQYVGGAPWIATLPLHALGTVWFCLGFAGMSLLGGVEGAGPGFVIRILRHVPAHAALACGLIFVLSMVRSMLVAVLATGPAVLAPISLFLTLWLAIAAARGLGLLLRLPPRLAS